VSGHHVVDRQELVLVGIDVLGVAGLEVERGGVVDIEGQTAGDTPSPLQILVEIVATGNDRGLP
jgi:hypothetical protein